MLEFSEGWSNHTSSCLPELLWLLSVTDIQAPEWFRERSEDTLATMVRQTHVGLSKGIGREDAKGFRSKFRSGSISRSIAVAAAQLSCPDDKDTLFDQLLVLSRIDALGLSSRFDNLRKGFNENVVSVIVSAAASGRKLESAGVITLLDDERIRADLMQPSSLVQLCCALATLGLEADAKIAVFAEAAAQVSSGLDDAGLRASLLWALVKMGCSSDLIEEAAQAVSERLLWIPGDVFWVLQATARALRGKLPECIPGAVWEVVAKADELDVEQSCHLVRLCTVLQDCKDVVSVLKSRVERDILALRSPPDSVAVWHSLSVVLQMPATDDESLTRWCQLHAPVLYGLSVPDLGLLIETAAAEVRAERELGSFVKRRVIRMAEDAVEAIGDKAADLVPQRAAALLSALTELGHPESPIAVAIRRYHGGESVECLKLQ
eukprot:Hpha_TRINITY_DN26961_c0_g1::TRINITY_DN26961_c0_g1_i1::g.24856::m.24856